MLGEEDPMAHWGHTSASRLRRALVCTGVAVLATTAVGAPALADPKPTPPAAAGARGPAPAGFRDWSAVYEYQQRLGAAAEEILAAGGAGNASIVANPLNRELQVYWKGGVPATVRSLAAGLDVPVAFHPAAYTHAELVTNAKRM